MDSRNRTLQVLIPSKGKKYVDIKSEDNDTYFIYVKPDVSISKPVE